MKNSNNEFMSVERISGPSKAVFNKQYGFASRPVLITGMTDNWNAMTRWTTEFFESRMGQYEALASRSRDRKDKKQMKVREYFSYMRNSTDNDPYYLSNCQFHLKTDMTADYTVPDYFSSCLQLMEDKLPLQFRLSWMFIGTANTYSALHLDIFNTSAWNAVITGRKLWLFYPSEQARYLYNGNVNPFSPDLEKYPEFSKAKPLVCVQHPGEVVFTPSGWWHAVLNEEGGISITENFINETNYDIVRATLAHYQKTEEARIVDECMTRYLVEENNASLLI